MDIVLTLVVNPGQSAILEKAVINLPDHIGQKKLEIQTLSPVRAVDIHFIGHSLDAVKSSITEALAPLTEVDWCLQEDEPSRRKSMLIADMDSTMITVECIDELADFVGAKEKVSAITEATMRGELNFEAALRERVALLKGLPASELEACYNDRIKIMPGARTLVQTMTSNGHFAALVSGGFTFFTEKVSQQIGFQAHRANILELENGKLTGRVKEPICGAKEKLTALDDYCRQQSLEPNLVLAVGDGANDIPMIQAAGLGVAYHAKPKTSAAAHASINNGDLTTLLFYQGYKETEFAKV